ARRPPSRARRVRARTLLACCARARRACARRARAPRPRVARARVRRVEGCRVPPPGRLPRLLVPQLGEDGVELLERLARGALDPFQGLRGGGWIMLEDAPAGGGLDAHDGQIVTDAVVQVTGDTDPVGLALGLGQGHL